MLSCTEISFVISFFLYNYFEKFGVIPGFPFLKLTLYNVILVVSGLYKDRRLCF